MRILPKLATGEYSLSRSRGKTGFLDIDAGMRVDFNLSTYSSILKEGLNRSAVISVIRLIFSD